MQTLSVKIQKLRENAKLPSYGSAFAAGADLSACLEAPVAILPGQTAMVPTGLAMELPEGYAGLVYARSGLACKKRIPENPQIFRNSNIKIMFPLNMARVQRRPFKIVFVKL